MNNIILDYTIHNIKNNFSLREMVVPTNGAEREQEREEAEEEENGQRIIRKGKRRLVRLRGPGIFM